MDRDRDLGPSVNSAPEWVICALLALARAGRLARSAWFAATVRLAPGPRLQAGFPESACGDGEQPAPRFAGLPQQLPAPARLPPLLAGAASLNSRLAATCSKASTTPGHQHNMLSRAEPVRTLTLRGGPYPRPSLDGWKPLCDAAFRGVQAQTFGCGSPKA